jgi:hypothetical protein
MLLLVAFKKNPDGSKLVETITTLMSLRMLLNSNANQHYVSSTARQ